MGHYVQCFANLKNKRAMRLGVRKLQDNTGKIAQEMAKIALHTASEVTPLYSGLAAINWRIALSRDDYDKLANLDIRPKWNWEEPKHQQGMWEWLQYKGYFTRTLNKRNYEALAALGKQVANGEQITIYLYNSAVYSKIWLNDEPDARYLREVNQPYWTMQDIKRYLASELKNYKT